MDKILVEKESIVHERAPNGHHQPKKREKCP